MKSPTIKTENYIIRPLKKEDASLWQEWDVDEEIQAHMPEPKNEVQDISGQYEYIEECEKDKEGYYWSIETSEGVTIGTVSLFEVYTHHKLANVGIVVGDKNYWGKGVATEVFQTLVPYAFEHLDISYIGAEVEADNTPMTRVFEKVGFTLDSLFKNARVKGEKRIDVLHFGVYK